MKMIADTVEVLFRLQQIGFVERLVRQVAFKYLRNSKVAFMQKDVRVHPRHTLAAGFRLAAQLGRILLPIPTPTDHRTQPS